MSVQKRVLGELERALNSQDIFERNTIEPDSWQKALLDSRQNTLVNCSRQAGKTLTACAIAVQHAGTRPKSLILFVAPSERQAKENLKRAYELLSGAGYASELRAKTVGELTFKNGSRIIAVSGQKPENIRGYPAVSLVVVDEAAYCIDELFAAVSPMLAINQHAKLIALSTPAGARGWFFKQFKFNDDFLKIEIPASLIERIPDAFLEAERKQLGEAQFRAEYLCDFYAADASLLSPEIIEQTFQPLGTLYTEEYECISTRAYSTQY